MQSSLNNRSMQFQSNKQNSIKKAPDPEDKFASAKSINRKAIIDPEEQNFPSSHS